MTRRKPKDVKVDPEELIDFSGLIAQASAALEYLRQTNERYDGLAGLIAVSDLIGASEPGSPIRAMTWRQVCARVAAQKVTVGLMKRSRWPNGNETLIT